MRLWYFAIQLSLQAVDVALGALTTDPLHRATKVAEAVLSQASVFELAEALCLSKRVAWFVQSLEQDGFIDLSSH